MIVGMCMTRSPLTVSPDAAICAAAKTMLENRIQQLPVVRHDDNLYVIRVSGAQVDALVEDLWRSGHQVPNVLR